MVKEDFNSKNELYENDTLSIIILFSRYSNLYIFNRRENIFNTSITYSTVSTTKKNLIGSVSSQISNTERRFYLKAIFFKETSIQIILRVTVL